MSLIELDEAEIKQANQPDLQDANLCDRCCSLAPKSCEGKHGASGKCPSLMFKDPCVIHEG